MATDDGDITLGPGRLLGLFFMLVAICGVFFAIGYSLGKTSAREQAMNDKPAVSASLGAPAVSESSASKPSAVIATASESQAGAKSEPDLTFYKAVKQTDPSVQSAVAGDTQLNSAKTKQDKAAEPQSQKNTPPVEASSVKPSAPLTSGTRSEPIAQAKADVKPMAAPAADGSYVVQIAAVSREEDAAALAGALRKKSYNVFVVNNPAAPDRLYHVQVGPFASLQDAEAMKVRLAGEGYNPIVKRS